MSATYPKPETPLPWNIFGTNPSDYDHHYLVRAANAFPHLVAALEEALPLLGGTEHEIVLNALAIARGETTP